MEIRSARPAKASGHQQAVAVKCRKKGPRMESPPGGRRPLYFAVLWPAITVPLVHIGNGRNRICNGGSFPYVATNPGRQCRDEMRQPLLVPDRCSRVSK